MKHITRWKPDTCNCVLEYEWDDQEPSDTRVHTPITVEACEVHSSITDVASGFDAVLQENKYKNEAVAVLMEKLPAKSVEIVTDKDGSVRKELKVGYEISFDFDGDRKLKLDVKGLSKLEKDAVLVQVEESMVQTKL